MNDHSRSTANGDVEALELHDECARLRARVAELERENGFMQEELERQFRREIQEGFGVTYEELLANPEKHSVSITDLLKELEANAEDR